jgi:glycolate oxidase FAD binding subunit
MAGITFRAPRDPLVLPGTIEHHLADLTATCAGDVPLAALQQTLAAAGQWLPIDGDPREPVGALISMNSTGPLRLGFGAWRDLLLGVQVRLRNGQLITAGARTMKNVAGYDLTKFMVGSAGRFGELATATVRTYRRPTHALLAEFTPSETLMGELIPSSARPQWSMIVGGRMYCGYLGDGAAIDFYQSELHTPLQSLHSPDDDIAFRAKHWLPQRDGVRFRVSVPPRKVLTFMQALSLENVAADPAFGIVVGACGSDDVQGIRQQVQAIAGYATFDDPNASPGSGEVDAATAAVLKRLESAFHPS